MIGLNISRQLRKPSWSNFHDNTHSRKLKYACNNTILRGAYLTDLFKDVIDPSSTNFKKQLTNEQINASVKLFKQEILDIKVNRETKFILFGKAVSHYFNQYFRHAYDNDIIAFRHYSSRGTDEEWVTDFWKVLNITMDYKSISINSLSHKYKSAV